MSKRINIQETDPEAYKAMLGLETFVRSSGINKTHLHLIKVRASQINGCAFCIDMHTKEALKDGETNQRLFLLNAWAESGLFSAEEQLLLELTEQITLISQGGVSEDIYQQAISTFGEKGFARILVAIMTINSWNRIAVTTHLPIAK